MTFRAVQESDREPIRQALESAIRVIRGRGKKYLQGEDWESGMKYIMDNDCACIFRDQYLVMLQAGVNWFTSSNIIVSEELILRVYPGDATYEDVVRFIEDRAAIFGATSVVIGTAGFRSSSPVHQLLESMGYQAESVQYIKEVTYE